MVAHAVMWAGVDEIPPLVVVVVPSTPLVVGYLLGGHSSRIYMSSPHSYAALGIMGVLTSPCLPLVLLCKFSSPTSLVWLQWSVGLLN